LAREQRRLAAIVAADVAGYSRLMGADESGTLAALKSLHKEIVDPSIAAFGGRIVKTTGDGLLLDFPSVVDAVRCVVEMQKAMAARGATMPEDRRIALRVGLHVGDVIIDGDDIFGDGVNVAARLEALAEPGGFCLSSDAVRQVRGKVDAAFDNMGLQALKNISQPIEVWRWSSNGGRAPAASTPMSLAMPSKPSIAVLPFQNMGGDPEQEYFADGITEDIITALSKWRSFLVIARNTTFTYKGRPVDVKQIGRELGARYVLEGSVRRAGARLRVTAQLIESDGAAHVWAERYDRELADVFAIQDDLSTRLAAIIETELGRHEQKRSPARPPNSLEAWDCLNRGLYLIYKFNRRDNEEAKVFLERAIALDPDLSRAHSSLAYTYQQDVMFGYAADRAGAIEQLIAHARRAVLLDDGDSYAHVMMGFGYRWSRQHELVLAEAYKAIECNPSDSWAHGLLGAALDLSGRHREGIEAMQRAITMNPRDPHIRFYTALVARAYLVDHDLTSAETWARRAIQQDPTNPRSHILLAASLAHLGRTLEAGAEVDAGERLDPGFAKRWLAAREYRDDADNNFVADGLRKAGLRD
jgi:adenylate cyclase